MFFSFEGVIPRWELSAESTSGNRRVYLGLSSSRYDRRPESLLLVSPSAWGSSYIASPGKMSWSKGKTSSTFSSLWHAAEQRILKRAPKNLAKKSDTVMTRNIAKGSSALARTRRAMNAN